MGAERIQATTNATNTTNALTPAGPSPSLNFSVLIDLITTDHRIVTPSAIFADYLEVDEDDDEMDRLLEELNNANLDDEEHGGEVKDK